MITMHHRQMMQQALEIRRQPLWVRISFIEAFSGVSRLILIITPRICDTYVANTKKFIIIEKSIKVRDNTWGTEVMALKCQL